MASHLRANEPPALAIFAALDGREKLALPFSALRANFELL